MTATTLPTFSAFAEDMVGAIVRALGSLEANGELGEAAGELSAVSVETAAFVAAVRRDTEAILAKGVEAKGFAAKCDPAAAALARYLPALAQYRQSLLRLPIPDRFLSDLETLIREIEALHKLLASAVAAGGLRTPAGFWERAAAVHGPFEDGDSVMDRVRAGGDI